MERYLSGYGMKIVMKSDATDEQMEIARKMYPQATVVRELQEK